MRDIRIVKDAAVCGEVGIGETNRPSLVTRPSLKNVYGLWG